jgi:hemolysin activation/secretion protein
MITRTIISALVILLVASASVIALPVTSDEVPAAEPGDAFDIWEFQVEGNTLLPSIDIERAVYSYLGEQKTIDDVNRAKQHLETLYHDRGYGSVFVDIPEQDVVAGIVRLKVTEAKVARLRVTGSRYFSLGRIKSQVPSLAAGRIPDLPRVQTELTALGRTSSDRQITPVLRPSKTPGKLEVELKVKDELPLHGSLELTDRYSADTSRLRLGASLRYDNLWQREHSIGGAYQISPQAPNEVEVFVGNYLWRFEQSDHLLAAYAVRSNTDVATIGTLGVLGSGTISGLRYTIPLATVGSYVHSITLGGDYKDFDEAIGFSGDVSILTPLSYLMFGANYNATLFGDKSLSHLALSFNYGPRGLGNTQKEFERKRFKAVPNFAYVRLTADHLAPLWRGATLFSRFDLQAADTPLVNNEQYSAGGADSVRGYLESEALGDDAVALSMELRSPNLKPTAWDWLHTLQLLSFTDAALMNTKSPLPGTDASNFLWSAGLGLTLDALDKVQAELFWAYPLRHGERVELGDSRVHFNVGYEF